MEQYEIDHLATVRAGAPESVVLLASDGSFPLAAPGKIALFGAGARRTVKGGTGSGDVNSRHVVTVEEGLENAGFEITTKAWLDA
ncbi:MAG: beta-1,3-N-acetylglucosaminyltransferase, partial [Actinomyces urogenitalis]|nr:beta-1,3-N-acetylglucosaminyltransferase [Actinomyces urogenitalis]